MAKLFVTLRLTGVVSNGVARDLLAQLQACTDAFELEGVEVKQSVDPRWDPEPIDVTAVAPEVALASVWAGVAVPEEPEPADQPKKLKAKFKGAR